ncbi:hypothetical protein ACLMJK_002657 [Lecanora helva]
MQFKTLFAWASFVAATVAQISQQRIAFTTLPTSVQAGQPVTLKWGGGDGSPVTITLQKGTTTNLKTVTVLTGDATGNSYTWTPSSSLPDAEDYALKIEQGDQTPNYTGMITLTGGSSSSASLTSAVSSASAYSTASEAAAPSSGSPSNSANSTASATPIVNANSTTAAPTGTGAVGTGVGASGSAATGTSMHRNTTLSKATLTSSAAATSSSEAAASTTGSASAPSSSSTSGAVVAAASNFALLAAAVVGVVYLG